MLSIFRLVDDTLKEVISLAVAGPQEFFKQHLIKNEEQPSFSNRYSTHFGQVSTV